ncbi:hypothetical protein FPV67DRAFT_1657736 [Lyophyllum atratum]|nr:hypothetical protein FPV67DRAFT_1657736 [Lyophyllum atratum]
MSDTTVASSSSTTSSAPSSSSTPTPPATSPPASSSPPTSLPPTQPPTSQPPTSSSTLPPTTSSTTLSTSTTPPPVTSQAPPAGPAPAPTQVFTTTRAGGGVLTTTSVVTASPTLPAVPPGSQASSDTTDDKGFFANKGAVAGVFSVVGLIALVLSIALITNVLRRRRAKRFDREVDEAAITPGPLPPFLSSSPSPSPSLSNNHSREYGGGGYSNSSHGTYAQPPLSTNGTNTNSESYGMREVPSSSDTHGNPYYAGVGVARSRSTRDPGAWANGLQEGARPYPAFAGPGAYQPYVSEGAVASGYHNAAPASVQGGYDGAGVQRGISLNHNQYPQQQGQRQSQTGYLPNPFAEPRQYTQPRPESYGTAYTQPQSTPAPAQPKEDYTARYTTTAPVLEENEEEEMDAYGGYVGEEGEGDRGSVVEGMGGMGALKGCALPLFLSLCWGGGGQDGVSGGMKNFESSRPTKALSHLHQGRPTTPASRTMPKRPPGIRSRLAGTLSPPPRPNGDPGT